MLLLSHSWVFADVVPSAQKAILGQVDIFSFQFGNLCILTRVSGLLIFNVITDICGLKPNILLYSFYMYPALFFFFSPYLTSFGLTFKNHLFSPFTSLENCFLFLFLNIFMTTYHILKLIKFYPLSGQYKDLRIMNYIYFPQCSSYMLLLKSIGRGIRDTNYNIKL